MEEADRHIAEMLHRVNPRDRQMYELLQPDPIVARPSTASTRGLIESHQYGPVLDRQ